MTWKREWTMREKRQQSPAGTWLQPLIYNSISLFFTGVAWKTNNQITYCLRIRNHKEKNIDGNSPVACPTL